MARAKILLHLREHRIGREQHIHPHAAKAAPDKIFALFINDDLGELLHGWQRHEQVNDFRVSTFDITQHGDPAHEQIGKAAFAQKREQFNHVTIGREKIWTGVWVFFFSRRRAARPGIRAKQNRVADNFRHPAQTGAGSERRTHAGRHKAVCPLT